MIFNTSLFDKMKLLKQTAHQQFYCDKLHCVCSDIVQTVVKFSEVLIVSNAA